MNQQINPVQVQAMLDSLQQQLTAACANIAARDGTLALQAQEIEQLKARIAELEAPKTEQEKEAE